MHWWQRLLIFGVVMMISACNRPWGGNVVQPKLVEIPLSTAPVMIEPSTPTPIPLPPTATHLPGAIIRWWFDEEIPEGLRQKITFPLGARQADQPAQANLRLSFLREGGIGAQWVYALVAPFPTIADQVEPEELMDAWKQGKTKTFADQPLLLSPTTLAVFTRKWGAPAGGAVKALAEAEIQSEAWQRRSAWAIIPFEQINPRWKVIRIGGHSPLQKQFSPSNDPLTVSFAFQGDAEVIQKLQRLVPNLLPKTNRDPDKLTTLVMTGVTALVRGTAWMMERNGMTFPGKSVRDWLVNADITHISNESSFDPACPPPEPAAKDLIFCSHPKYIELLEFVGADVIELTGNHLNDYGLKGFIHSVSMYKQRQWQYYGGGENSQRASQPITMTHNGNRLVFIGCNIAGPPKVWATSTQPGAAKCDLDALKSEIRRLSKEGLQVIVTVQYYESYDPRPLPIHYQDFRELSDAGAVIVSGSQAHLPQAMELRGTRFIHYGLGNLFFDQMDTPWPDTRDEFIDQHVFYDGRYLGVELLTARLVDFVRPRPMTAAERSEELRAIFDVSHWRIDIPTEWK